jgi:hypothetical protein
MLNNIPERDNIKRLGLKRAFPTITQFDIHSQNVSAVIRCPGRPFVTFCGPTGLFGHFDEKTNSTSIIQQVPGPSEIFFDTCQPASKPTNPLFRRTKVIVVYLLVII